MRTTTAVAWMRKVKAESDDDLESDVCGFIFRKNLKPYFDK